MKLHAVVPEGPPEGQCKKEQGISVPRVLELLMVAFAEGCPSVLLSGLYASHWGSASGRRINGLLDPSIEILICRVSNEGETRLDIHRIAADRGRREAPER